MPAYKVEICGVNTAKLPILKETEKESKNMFGMYSSQRMKDWRTIVSNFEKNSVYIGSFVFPLKLLLCFNSNCVLSS